MNHATNRLAAIASLLAIVLGGCADPQALSETKTKIGEIQTQQKEILAKLDAIDKGQKEMATKVAAPARPPGPPPEDPNKVYTVPIGDSFAKGPANAPVTVVAFSDFQCPFCAQAATLPEQILEAYPKDVRFVFKNYPLPFHPHAMPAAKAAIAAGKQGKFFEMHDKIFASSKNLGEEVYVKAAQDIGLDVEKFKADMASEEVNKQIQQEMADARTADVRGTPTFFINGKKPQGRSLELYKQMIDDILKEKKAG